MAIEILLTIPDEFDNEFIKNQFSASLLRLAADANTLAGDYEKETAAMLIEAFKNSKWIDNKCSACGKGIEDLIDSREWYENEKPNYCPFCGKPVAKE